jgi:hypothetical protein
MSAMIHASHSIVFVDRLNFSECSKCWSCTCHESNTLTKPCTDKANRILTWT